MNLKFLFIRYKWRFILTFVLIVLESSSLLLFPLFIGKAIDGLINQNFSGAIYLAMLGVSVLVIGVGRRVFDSRFYAKAYQDLGVSKMIQIQHEKTSVKTARLNMIKELVEFFENALPELINNIFGLVGVVIILFVLNTSVFVGSCIVTCIIFLVYWLSSKKIMAYNEKVNDEMERQVDTIANNNTIQLQQHLKETMRWNIKLSDLEALNFSLSWLVALAFLIAAIIIAINDGIVKYGTLFALVMYVFQYIENVISLPLFYQHWLRLREILYRLKN